MIEFVHGIVERVLDDAIVLRCSGIALRLRTPRGAGNGASVGTELRLYAQLMLREEVFGLYGFRTEPERDLFNVLRSVSGLGPEKALMLLTALPPAQLAAAIRREDKPKLRSVKGIGDRLADRLILELKDGLDEFLSAAPAAGTEPPTTGHDLSRALQQLGYARAQADEAAALAAKAAAKDSSFEDVLKAALRLLQRGAASP